ncbi:MAG: YabN family protein [Actinomycetota bacterium]|nr:MazG family protein [Actinomycetota bacterium]
MSRVVLVRQGSGSPDLLPLEAWQALTSTSLVAAAPGDALSERLREAERTVVVLPAASRERLRGDAPGATGVPSLRLLAHVHEQTLPGAAGLADELARLAVDRGEVVFILPVEDPEAITKAVFERALRGDIEVEVVIGRAPAGHKLLDLVRVMARLRGPGGCPWDAEQTHASLAKYLLDETYELLEAIEGDDRAHMAEELGDLLLQVVFHAEIAVDGKEFDIDDIADRLTTKLITRHPHVFGDVDVEGSSEVVANWEVIKDVEKGRSSVLEGVPEALPALAYAQKLLKRAARASLPPAVPSEDAPADEEAFGELLLSVVAAARAAGIDAESALRRAARGFRDRLARVEEAARARGLALQDVPAEDARALWDAAR